MRELQNNLKSKREDLSYLKKELMLQGVMPSDIGGQDYDEFLQVLHSKKREDRVMSAADAHKRLRGG